MKQKEALKENELNKMFNDRKGKIQPGKKFPEIKMFEIISNIHFENN